MFFVTMTVHRYLSWRFGLEPTRSFTLLLRFGLGRKHGGRSSGFLRGAWIVRLWWDAEQPGTLSDSMSALLWPDTLVTSAFDHTQHATQLLIIATYSHSIAPKCPFKSFGHAHTSWIHSLLHTHSFKHAHLFMSFRTPAHTSAVCHSNASRCFFFSFCLKLPPRGFEPIWLAEECLMRAPLDTQLLSLVSLSVGECIDPMDSDDMDDDRFRFDDIAKESRSSPGRQDSTIIAFSRQLTNSSAMSLDPVD